LIIVADQNIPAVAEVFGSLGTVRQVNGRQLSAADLTDADLLLVRSVTRVDRELLATTKVRFVGSATSGLDHLDRDYLQRRGIGCAHAPGSNANSVVEYVLATIACVDQKLEQLLAGGIVGIVGYGIIGKRLAATLQALGIRYCVYDPWLVQADIDHRGTLERVLKADVVTLHCSLIDRRPWPSRHLLGEHQLASIGSDALLINASRGPVVNNRALRTLLSAGAGPTAVLDVWEGEPRIDASLLRRVRYGTPHIAGYSLDGKLKATRMLYEAVADFFQVDLPAPATGGPARAALMLAEGLHGPALLRHLLLLHYDVRVDDSALRSATFEIDPRIAAAGFDRLRRHYPPRRELRGLVVAGQDLSNHDLALLRALGCCCPAGREESV
jgi:erythronate-4-phosphate dehydrogenase